MTDEEIAQGKEEIDAMSREEMARLWRFGSSSKCFRDPLFEYFQARFKELGGWSAELSKKIGWG